MKKYAIEIKWGVIFAIMGLVWMFIERSVGLHDDLIAHHATYTNLIAIPAIAIYVFALLEKRNINYLGSHHPHSFDPVDHPFNHYAPIF